MNASSGIQWAVEAAAPECNGGCCSSALTGAGDAALMRHICAAALKRGWHLEAQREDEAGPDDASLFSSSDEHEGAYDVEVCECDGECACGHDRIFLNECGQRCRETCECGARCEGRCRGRLSCGSVCECGRQCHGTCECKVDPKPVIVAATPAMRTVVMRGSPWRLRNTRRRDEELRASYRDTRRARRHGRWTKCGAIGRPPFAPTSTGEECVQECPVTGANRAGAPCFPAPSLD